MRPSTKSTLLEASELKYKELNLLIDSLGEKELNTEYDFSDFPKKKEAHWSRDKNLRDILMHLFEWQKLLIDWIESNKNNENIKFLIEPYTWKTIADMNNMFLERNQSFSLEEAKANLESTHKYSIDLISSFTNEELFEKKHFSWTGTTSVGSYCVSALPSHYDWAIKKIKAHIKRCKSL